MNQRKITKRYAIIIIATAILFDLFSLVPGASFFTGILGQAVLAGLFWVGGVNVFKDKKLVTYVLATLIEIAPQSSFLPFFTIGALAIISLSWAKRP